MPTEIINEILDIEERLEAMSLFTRTLDELSFDEYVVKLRVAIKKHSKFQINMVTVQESSETPAIQGESFDELKKELHAIKDSINNHINDAFQEMIRANQCNEEFQDFHFSEQPSYWHHHEITWSGNEPQGNQLNWVDNCNDQENNSQHLEWRGPVHYWNNEWRAPPGQFSDAFTKRTIQSSNDQEN